jgi:hypothetical protein
MFTLYKCEEAKPYTCKQAHYENHLRRKPQLVYHHVIYHEVAYDMADS